MSRSIAHIQDLVRRDTEIERAETDGRQRDRWLPASSRGKLIYDDIYFFGHAERSASAPLWTWSFKHLRACCSGTWSWRLIISSRCAGPIAAGKKAEPSPRSKYFQGISSGWSLTAVLKLLWWSRPSWCLGVACTTPIPWLETLWSMGLWPVAIAVGSWTLGRL